MLKITDKQRNIIKVLLMTSVILSMYFGLQGLFIDLYEPGSQTARDYSDIVNVLFVASIVISLPLVFEKFQKFNEFAEKYENSGDDKKSEILYSIAKPIIRKIAVIVILTIIASILLTLYWNIPQDVITNYQNYYYGNNNNLPLFTKTININNSNNISYNLSFDR